TTTRTARTADCTNNDATFKSCKWLSTMAEELAIIEKVFLLQSIDLFSNAEAEALVRLASIAREERYESGDVIQKEGAAPDAFYVVVRGRITLRSENLNRSEES